VCLVRERNAPTTYINANPGALLQKNLLERQHSQTKTAFIKKAVPLPEEQAASRVALLSALVRRATATQRVATFLLEIENLYSR